MQYKYLIHKHHPRLLVIFAGWGMDYRLFDTLKHGAYDIIVVWDYRQLYSEERGETRPFGFLLARVKKYQEICVLAWSFGVYAAQQVLEDLSPNLSRCIAVNGTVCPIDDMLGIPAATFRGTLDNLNEKNWHKFFRRVCGTPERMAEVESAMPKREIEDLIDELRVIGHGALNSLGREVLNPHRKWDMAIISRRDAIFPLENQRRAWASNTVVEVDGPHLPTFQEIIDSYLIDKLLVAKRFSEAFSTYTENASVQQEIADHLWQCISKNFYIEKCEDMVLELGCGTGIFTRLYAPKVKARHWELWDIADVPAECVPTQATVRKCDAEMELRSLPYKSVDAIVSNCVVQWFSSPSRYLSDCMRAIKSRGILAFSTFDADNLPELRALGTPALTTPTLEEWQEMMPKGMKIVEADRREYTLYFPSPRAVLEHLRLTGVNALGSTPSLSTLRTFISNYPHTEKGYPLTYKALTIIAACKQLV